MNYFLVFFQVRSGPVRMERFSSMYSRLEFYKTPQPMNLKLFELKGVFVVCA